MSNNNPLRIFTDQEIGQLLNHDIKSLEEQKLAPFNANNDHWKFNGHQVTKKEAEQIFDTLKENLIDTIALYRYQSLPDFIDSDDIKLFHKLHQIPFEEMDPDVSEKMHDLIATKVNILLPKHISLNDPNIGVVTAICAFFQNLSPKHSQAAFNTTYDYLDSKVDHYIKKYPKPFNKAFLKGTNLELTHFIASNTTYDLLNKLPNMFESIRIKYGKWLAAGMNNTLVLKGRPPTLNASALSALGVAACVAKEYDEPAKNTAKQNLIARQLIQLKGGTNEQRRFSKLILLIALIVFCVAAFFSFKSYYKTDNQPTDYNTNQYLKVIGPNLKLIDDAKSYDNIYPNPDNVRLATILGDYLGAHPKALNPELVSNTNNVDHIELQFEVDALPIDYKNIKEYIDKSISELYLDQSRDVIINFSVRSDKSLYSSNTMKVKFPEDADIWVPEVKFGYESGKGGRKPEAKIKKIKAKEFDFVGTLSHYYVGAHDPYKTQQLKLWYELGVKSYMYRGDDIPSGKIDLDLFKEHKINKGDVIDEYRFASVVNNFKLVQNKLIKKGGFYKLSDATHTFSNSELDTEYPLREVIFDEGLLLLKGKSLADGNTYVKILMDYSQVGLIVDVDGYIKQYQQVTIDKGRGVIEKMVLVRK